LLDGAHHDSFRCRWCTQRARRRAASRTGCLHTHRAGAHRIASTPRVDSNHDVGVSRLWCRAEYRQRWFQYVTVALLIGFVGAAVLTCAAAARRTNSAYPRYLRTQFIPDVEASLAESANLATVAKQVRAIEGVQAVGAYDALFAAPNRDGILPGQNFMVFTPLDDEYGRTVDRIIVLDGRMPAPTRRTRSS
jgi:hypothetical protein